jgi:hemerythrin-like domain-containing protein
VVSKRGHVFFFDVRNTLGVVDRMGHLIRFRPSADELLRSLKALPDVRLAVITNVPAGVDATAMLAGAGLDGYFEKIVSTQDPEILAAKAQKPQRAMYELAAQAMGVDVGDCTYVSENLLEVLGAIGAGMQGVVKKFPPGGDYMRANLSKSGPTQTASGRLAEVLLEGQHMVGKRIVVAAVEITKRIRAGDNPLAPKSPLLSAMNRLVWLVNHFVDPFHHRMEEEVLIPYAHMRGYPSSKTAWILEEHEQGRAYFKSMTIALNRVQGGNAAAALEFANVTEAFTQLYKAHGAREDDETFKEIGDLLTDEDDAAMCGMIERLGPPDITLHYDMIQGMETDLGVQQQ